LPTFASVISCSEAGTSCKGIKEGHRLPTYALETEG